MNSIDNGYLNLVKQALKGDDVEAIRSVERLRLESVDVKIEDFSAFEQLWWLDFRAGRISDLGILAGLEESLLYLEVLRFRNLANIDKLSDMRRVEYLNLYGLPLITESPDLSGLTNLLCLRVGLMKRLTSISGFLAAPRLERLYIDGKVAITDEDIEAINTHPTLKWFRWNPSGIPDRIYKPIREAIIHPSKAPIMPQQWFGSTHPKWPNFSPAPRDET